MTSVLISGVTYVPQFWHRTDLSARNAGKNEYLLLLFRSLEWKLLVHKMTLTSQLQHHSAPAQLPPPQPTASVYSFVPYINIASFHISPHTHPLVFFPPTFSSSSCYLSNYLFLSLPLIFVLFHTPLLRVSLYEQNGNEISFLVLLQQTLIK